MKKQMMHRAVLGSPLITLLLPLCLTLPALGQQKGSVSAGSGQQHQAAAPASQGSAAPAASTDSSTPAPPPTVLGTGTVNFIPVWTGRRTIGNSILSQAGKGLNVAGGVTATSFSGDGYLYGEGAQVMEVDGSRRAVPMPRKLLLGPSKFPTGLFSDDQHSELSAIIFSNACSLAKLNRVAVSGRGAPEGLRYTRIGRFFDRTPGALEGIPFCLDITCDKYRQLWPQGYEPWSAELEVFHNPFARHPVPLELLPEATHCFEEGGEQVCRSFYATSILWSMTLITDLEKPEPRLEDLLAKSDPEE